MPTISGIWGANAKSGVDYVVTDDDYLIPEAPKPQPIPQVPPEVWNSEPVDAERAMAAVRAMCG